MTISPVAHAAGLGFIPFAEEHYDFALVTARKQRLAVRFSTRSPRTKFAPC
jgi:molybdate-binding protein